jgi:hypothetical protein
LLHEPQRRDLRQYEGPGEVPPGPLPHERRRGRGRLRGLQGQPRLPARQAEARRLQRAQPGLVLADEGESPLKIGYTEWKRRTDEQVKKVKAGTLKRAPLKDEDVVSPEEQKRRAAEAARRAALQRARTGPLVSCPRNVPYEVCLRDYERRRLAAQPKKKINPFLVVGLGLTGLLLIVAASRAGR